MAKPTPAPDLSAFTDILRELFAAMAAPPPKPSKLKAKGTVVAPPTEAEDEASDDDEEEDAMEQALPMPMGPMSPGKGMRRVTISILMPAKGLPPKR